MPQFVPQFALEDLAERIAGQLVSPLRSTTPSADRRAAVARTRTVRSKIFTPNGPGVRPGPGFPRTRAYAQAWYDAW